MRNLFSAAALRVAGMVSMGLAVGAPAGMAEAASAAFKTRVFAVSNMTCATCPISVKTAMRRIAGVKDVRVDFDAKTATVTFDPAIATPARIAAAATAVGFPTQPVGR